MTICLLCTSEAVADGLCVEDGARLHVATQWERKPHVAAAESAKMHTFEPAGPMPSAHREIDSLAKATAFLARLDKARTKRDTKNAADNARGVTNE